MTTYYLWPEGYRKNQDSAEIEADSADEAVIKLCNQLWYDEGYVNKSAWLANAKTIFCQAAGDDKPLMFSVAVEVEPVFYVEEV